MHDNFMKKNPYRNKDRTSMKKYHNFMKEKSRKHPSKRTRERLRELP